MGASINPVQLAGWLVIRFSSQLGQLGLLALPVACVLAILLAASLPVHPAGAAEPATPGSEQTGAPTEHPAPSGPPATIDGFREAHFGMTEDQVREAIKRDFPAAAKPKIATHPSEKTAVLSLLVPDLLPHSGNALISYILGYKSKRLIQVNILWTSEGSEDSDEAVVGVANSLRNYFAAQNFKPDSVVVNRQLAENTIVVFRASDLQSRTVLVLLAGAGAAARKDAKTPRPPPLTLELSYIADAAHPDIFKIGKGQF
jgi:hypothetical protein